MKCPICEKDVELQKKQVGVDEQGTPIFHQYAVCRDCKKQWDLDKQRARKAASAQRSGAASVGKPSTEGKVKQKLASAAPPPEKKAEQESVPTETLPEKKAVKKPVPAGVSSEKKADKKPVPAEASSEKKAVKKPVPAGASSEKKAVKKPMPAEASSGKKADKKAVPAEISSEGKTDKKPISAETASEKKTDRKPGSGEAAPERKPHKKPASPESTSDRKVKRGLTSQEPAPGRPASVDEASRRTASGKPSIEKEGSGKPSAENTPGRRPISGKAAVKKERPVPGDRDAADSSAGHPKKSPAKRRGAASGEQRYGNIPPDKVRAKKEHAVRKGYEDMLSTDPNYKPPKKKKLVSENEDLSSDKKERPVSVRQRPHTKAEVVDDREEDIGDEEVKARFRIPRFLLGIISIVAAGFFAYGGVVTVLDGIAAGGTASAGTAFIVYGICMLVSGLILIILQNRNSILAFILPMLAYFGGAAFTFLNRKNDPMLLYCAVAGAVLGIIFLILGIISRNSGSDDSEDYDDPFENDYE